MSASMSNTRRLISAMAMARLLMMVLLPSLGDGLVRMMIWGRFPFWPEKRIDAIVARNDSAISDGFRVHVTSSTDSVSSRRDLCHSLGLPSSCLLDPRRANGCHFLLQVAHFGIGFGGGNNAQLSHIEVEGEKSRHLNAGIRTLEHESQQNTREQTANQAESRM